LEIGAGEYWQTFIATQADRREIRTDENVASADDMMDALDSAQARG
jgi:hypothetical protein